MLIFGERGKPDYLEKSLSEQGIACSRLRDGGGKSFSNKKGEKRARAGERQGGLDVRPQLFGIGEEGKEDAKKAREGKCEIVFGNPESWLITKWQ